MSIRLVRVRTGDDGRSLFYVGKIGLPQFNAILSTETGQARPEKAPVGATSDFPTDPNRPCVTILTARLELETADGTRQVIEAGDVVLMDDEASAGCRWRLIDHKPY